MGSQERIEQIVVVVLLLILAIGCLTVLRPFLSALLWAPDPVVRDLAAARLAGRAAAGSPHFGSHPDDAAGRDPWSV